MTSAAVTLPEAAEPPAASASTRRLASSVEFLAVGGATLFLFPLLWLLRKALGLDTAELAVGFLMFHGAHLLNDPHFAVTYLLFYKNFRQRALGAAFTPAQRARYWLAGILVPVTLAVWLTLALLSNSAGALGA
ncbi:MAG TPA: hypothetical protein VK745_12355, partial [Polyangiaceae bacterium]|nr:hypothetical protein [Polyangiaceae bacterium]